MDENARKTAATVEPKFDPSKFEERLTAEDRAGRDQMGTDGPMAHVPKPLPTNRRKATVASKRKKK